MILKADKKFKWDMKKGSKNLDIRISKFFKRIIHEYLKNLLKQFLKVFFFQIVFEKILKSR